MMLYLLFLTSQIYLALAQKRFKAHDRVAVIANTVGPFTNPTETYPVSLLIYIHSNYSNQLFTFVVICVI